MEKLFPDPIVKTQNWACHWINDLKFYIVCLYCMLSWVLSKYIAFIYILTNCFYLIWSFLKLTKRGLELVSLHHFLHDFWIKMFLVLYSIKCKISLPGWFYFVRHWAIYVLQLLVNKAVTWWTCKLTLSF